MIFLLVILPAGRIVPPPTFNHLMFFYGKKFLFQKKAFNSIKLFICRAVDGSTLPVGSRNASQIR